jgi:hypothetical protein
MKCSDSAKSRTSLERAMRITIARDLDAAENISMDFEIRCDKQKGELPPFSFTKDDEIVRTLSQARKDGL